MGADIRDLGIQLIRFSGKRDVRRPSPFLNAGATMIHGVAPNERNLDLAIEALESNGAPSALLERVVVLKTEVSARISTRDRR